jgi:hypothetical protein
MDFPMTKIKLHLLPSGFARLSAVASVAIAAVLAAVLAAPAVSQAQNDNAMQKYKVDIPPSADLIYNIRSKQSGLAIEGTAIAHWSATAGKYAIVNEARASLFGKILDSKSEGRIDEHGLAPLSFVEKRIRRDQTTTTFDRSTQLIRFSTTDVNYPIKGGEQDRNSVIWQLIAVARAAPARFKPGSDWTFFVAGQRDAEPWTFKVIGAEKIRTSLGDMATMHISKVPPPDSKDQQVDIWLGPQQEWFPIRIRYTDNDGDFIEQTLDQINRKPA